jgi:hypothetical protein
VTACILLFAADASGVVGQDQGKQDKGQNFPAPPKGFDSRRDGIDRGKLETIEYDSTTVGVKRKVQIYTPPGYSNDQKYRFSTFCTASGATSRSGLGVVRPTLSSTIFTLIRRQCR